MILLDHGQRAVRQWVGAGVSEGADATERATRPIDGKRGRDLLHATPAPRGKRLSKSRVAHDSMWFIVVVF